MLVLHRLVREGGLDFALFESSDAAIAYAQEQAGKDGRTYLVGQYIGRFGSDVQVAPLGSLYARRLGDGASGVRPTAEILAIVGPS